MPRGRCSECNSGLFDSPGDCSWCNGTGANTLLSSPDPKCPHCKGTGVCPACNGSGYADGGNAGLQSLFE